ncbi:MAG TPA: hypothetical protein VKM55_29785 [Candidatus Lokiarchaeia archaeon]|nr:hypothetical protein [Candidatus Lokiarchaeia archaeon]
MEMAATLATRLIVVPSFHPARRARTCRSVRRLAVFFPFKYPG